MRILVTGASGFIGRALIARLLADGCEVVGVARRPQPPELLGRSGLRWVCRDLTNSQLGPEEVVGCDALCHLAGATLGAGSDPALFFAVNEQATLNVLACCAPHIGRVIHASSQVVYGDPRHLAVTEHFPLAGQDSAYACSKLNAENWMRHYQKRHGGDYTLLRLSGFISGGGAIDYMLTQALTDAPIELFERGVIHRDYMGLADGIEAFVLALRHQTGPGVNEYNIGGGEAMPGAEMARLICAETGSRSDIVLLDKTAARGDFVFDIDKARTELGFHPASLQHGLHAYIQQRLMEQHRAS